MGYYKNTAYISDYVDYICQELFWLNVVNIANIVTKKRQYFAEKKYNCAEKVSFGAIRFRFGAIRFRFGAIRFCFDGLSIDFGAIRFAANALSDAELVEVFPFVGPH